MKLNLTSRVALALTAMMLCCSLSAQNQFPLRFDWGTEFLPENFADVRRNPAVAPGEVVNGYYVRLLQCRTIPAAADRAAVEAAGAKFLGYLPVGAYFVALPAGFEVATLDRLDVRSCTPVQSAWKIARSLREKPYGAWAVHGDRIDVNVQVYPHVTIAEGAERLRKLGFQILFTGNQNGFLRVRMPADALEALAAEPFVRWLELKSKPGEPEDTNGRSIHRASLLDSESGTGLKYNGEGVNVLVRDDGAVGPHIDFWNRLTNLTPNDGGIHHGDGVAGIIGGAGNLDPTNRGMAAGSNVYVVDYQADFQDQTLPLYLSDNVRVTNTSYSDGCNDGYTTGTQTVDQQLWDNQGLMHVFSAGNAGTSNCDYGAGSGWGNITGGHKMAKNAIATANLAADMSLESSSSRGPAYDGRLKPDLAAHGQGQISTDPNNTYQTFGGTSAAAPGVAGVLVQLTHAYKSLNNGAEPSAALLKAALMNTANDLGRVGPDFEYGWGHLNAWRALKLLEENRYTGGETDQGSTVEHTVTIPAGVRQAKMMIYWVEPPAQPSAARSLINDLDLTVATPDGQTKLPWRLDPTPTVAALTAPAGVGRDSLNNTEQVAIENPAPGDYTIKITGTEVPFGPQAYIIVWDFQTDAIKLTYPNGGEGLVPGENVTVHWDAYGTTEPFTVEYSNNGINWTSIGNAGGAQRSLAWTVPFGMTSQGRLRLTRGAQTVQTDDKFSIAAVPQNLRVERACPDSITFGWNLINPLLRYDVYLLGSKFMELAGTTDGGVNTLALPITDASEPLWYSVRATNNTGMTGRRAIAQYWPGGLKNCPQDFDLFARALQEPASSTVFGCGAVDQPVTLRVRNEGLNAVTGATVSYQFNNGTPVTETLPDLAVGDSIDYTFNTPLTLSGQLVATLRVWTTFPGDAYLANDTLEQELTIVAQAATGFFTEDFEAQPGLPLGWASENPDGGIGWDYTPANITGIDDSPTRAFFLDHYDYTEQGEVDYLYMIPSDLTGLTDPALRFDRAHAQYPGYVDGLRVELFAGCDLGAAPVVLWEQSDPELSTVGTLNAQFTPDAGTDWKTAFVSLEPWIGQKVVIRFAALNGYGNNLYLDNIGIESNNITPPVAPDIESSEATICRLDTVYFEAAPAAPGTTLSWTFGTQAQPSNASGPGPHAVRYLGAGNKIVRIIATNAFGADTTQITYPVVAPAVANFTSTATDLTVTFTSTSSGATEYLWDFGDGQTSTEANPTHTYAAPGAYTVTLTVTNACGPVNKVVQLMLTSSVRQPDGLSAVTIQPNPTHDGDFLVRIECRSDAGPAALNLYDAQGRVVHTVHTVLTQGARSIPFHGLGLPAGLYLLSIQTPSGVASYKVAVE